MFSNFDAVSNPMSQVLHVLWNHLGTRMRVGGGDKNVVRRYSKCLLNSKAGVLNRCTGKSHKVTCYQYNLIVTVVKNERLGMKVIVNP